MSVKICNRSVPLAKASSPQFIEIKLLEMNFLYFAMKLAFKGSETKKAECNCATR